MRPDLLVAMKRVGPWTCCLVALLLGSGCSDQSDSGAAPITNTPPVPTAITDILDSLRSSHDLPALGAAIVTRDTIWVLDVVGRRRYGGSTSVTVDDKFHIGSNLKAMTAGLIGRLVDQAAIGWNTTLEQALPDLASTMRSEYRSITIRELLSQQSGLVRDATIAFTDATPRLQRESMTRWALQQPPASGRGSYFYSNVNYIIAGAIAERATNTAFEQLIVERLLEPIGITTVGFGAPGTPGTEDQPWQHYFNNNGQRVSVPPAPTADNPPIYGPAGRAHMSLRDWARWILVVLRAEAGQGNPWQPATAKLLTTPAVSMSPGSFYGLGWVTTTRSWAGPTGRVLTHDGTNTLSYSAAWLAPDAGFGVIVVTNQGGTLAASAVDATAGRLINFYLSGR